MALDELRNEALNILGAYGIEVSHLAAAIGGATLSPSETEELNHRLGRTLQVRQLGASERAIQTAVDDLATYCLERTVKDTASIE